MTKEQKPDTRQPSAPVNKSDSFLPERVLRSLRERQNRKAKAETPDE